MTTIYYEYSGHQHIWKQMQLTDKSCMPEVWQEKVGRGLRAVCVYAWPVWPPGLCTPDQKSLAQLAVFRISVSGTGLEGNLGLGNTG